MKIKPVLTVLTAIGLSFNFGCANTSQKLSKINETHNPNLVKKARASELPAIAAPPGGVLGATFNNPPTDPNSPRWGENLGPY
jgi:hypothetical protein